MNDHILYREQTELALRNFRFSSFRFPRPFLAALGMIKGAAADVNAELGLLAPTIASAIVSSAGEVEAGQYDVQFPLDIFQTGSCTSTNMNANEVIASLATLRSGIEVHPNDHVNLGQSSNDVIPSAIHLSAVLEVSNRLIPSVTLFADAISRKAGQMERVIKTGRTHLMDALPIRMSQELSGWEALVRAALSRLRFELPRMEELAMGGTAVGTGLNTHPRFGALVAERLAAKTGMPFRTSRNYFASISAQEPALALSAQLRGMAATFFKISNDLRWMNSGPVAGLGEITLVPLQAGSSMMPGKVNPVLPEAVAMICAQVQGNDAAILMAAQSGSFQLNTMLPLIAWNLLSSINLMTGAADALAECVSGFTVNESRIRQLASQNNTLVTALAPLIGYDQSAAIAREALDTGKSIQEVASLRTALSKEKLAELLDLDHLV